MVRVLRLEGDRVRAGGRELAPPGGPFWLDCGPEPATLEWLASRFGFHPLALEDASKDGQRNKFEDYPGTAFVVFHRLDTAGAGAEPVDLELHCFLTADALVTVHRHPIAELEAVHARVTEDPDVMRRGPDFVLYLLLDAITDSHFDLADDLSDRVEVLNDEISEDPKETHVMTRVAELRHELTQLRRRLAPQREVLAALARPGQAVVNDRTVVYFRDVEDHVVRITETIDMARDLVAQTMEIYLSAVNNRVSVVMARLALVSTIFLPLTFLTGVFGMNLPGTDHPLGWWIVGGTALLLPPSMWLWFRLRGWF